MKKRRLRILKFAAIAVAVMALVWGASAIAVYAVSSERVFYSASIDAVPHRRAAVADDARPRVKRIMVKYQP